MKLSEFVRNDQELDELVPALARGAAALGRGAAKVARGTTNAVGTAATMMGEPAVGKAFKQDSTGAVANALAKQEKDPATQAAERKELADKIQELEAQIRELRKAQQEV